MGGGSSKKKTPESSASFKMHDGQHSCLTSGCFGQDTSSWFSKDTFGQLQPKLILVGWKLSTEHKNAILTGLRSWNGEIFITIITEYLIDDKGASVVRSIHCNLRSGLFKENGFNPPASIFETPARLTYKQNALDPSLPICPNFVRYGLPALTRKESESINIVVVGDGAVGKSSIVQCLIAEQFCTYEYDPTIEDFEIKNLAMPDGQTVRLEILDTAGKEEFAALTEQWYRQADVVMVCASHDRPSRVADQFRPYVEKFERCRDLYISGGRKLGKMKSSLSDTAAVVLVGCKCDLPVRNDRRASDVSRVTPMSLEYDLPYIETSAKFCVNVDLAFQTAVYEYWLSQMYFCRG